jgi:hypothetical protein
MADDKYPIQQELADLKKTLDSDPTNVESAIRYWSGLASFGGGMTSEVVGSSLKHLEDAR